jgi:hypothetical protein
MLVVVALTKLFETKQTMQGRKLFFEKQWKAIGFNCVLKCIKLCFMLNAIMKNMSARKQCNNQLNNFGGC